MTAQTIVLRFADYQDDTIAAHRKIIEDSGSTLWGWWKKRHEPYLQDVFDELRRHCPLVIGLVDRGQRKFYEADCSSIECGPLEQDIASPKPDLTPEYYRDEKHPVWLVLTGIRLLDYDGFRSRFMEPPTGDQTIFPVGEPGPAPPSPLMGGGLVETCGNSILHLSDLHFGDMHGFELTTTKDPVVSPCLLDLLTPLITSVAPPIGVVVVSGDLVTKGDANDFVYAIDFLRNLLKVLRLEPSHVVLVPGNHDLWVKDKKHATSNFAHEEGYRIFASSFYGCAVTNIEAVWHFLTQDGWEYVFCGMNSARPRSPETADYGYVGADRLKPLLALMKQIETADPDNERRIKIAVLHHHLLPGLMVEIPEPGRPVSLTLDAGQLTRLLTEAGTDFCLHGHKHLPVLGSTARASHAEGAWGDIGSTLTVIGCGSSGGKTEILQDEKRENTIGVYAPTDAGMRVQYWQYNRRTQPSQLFESTIPRG